jgi:hypothetical protein
MHKSYLLYHAYGHQDYVNECIYSIMSFYRESSEWSRQNIYVIVYTDMPEAFDKVKDLGILLEIEPITAPTIHEWRGVNDYEHRVKVKMMQHFSTKYGGNMLYVDSDTCFETDLKPIFERIQKGEIFMDFNEGALNSEANRSNVLLNKVHEFIKTAIFYNGILMIEPTLEMWITGTIGFNYYTSYILAGIEDLTDDFYNQYPKPVAERLAFCHYLQKKGPITASRPMIFHYQHFTEFRPILVEFFERNAEKNGKEIAELTGKLLPQELMQPKIEYQELGFFTKAVRKIMGNGWKMPKVEW